MTEPTTSPDPKPTDGDMRYAALKAQADLLGDAITSAAEEYAQLLREIAAVGALQHPPQTLDDVAEVVGSTGDRRELLRYLRMKRPH